jgi:hypothetical protein
MWHVVHFKDDFLKLCFLDELYFIMKFYEYSWMDFHLVKMASNPNDHDKNGFKNMKFEVNTSQFALNMFKIKLWVSLNFERVFLKR